MRLVCTSALVGLLKLISIAFNEGTTGPSRPRDHVPRNHRVIHLYESSAQLLRLQGPERTTHSTPFPSTSKPAGFSPMEQFFHLTPDIPSDPTKSPHPGNPERSPELAFQIVLHRRRICKPPDSCNGSSNRPAYHRRGTEQSEAP